MAHAGLDTMDHNPQVTEGGGGGGDSICGVADPAKWSSDGSLHTCMYLPPQKRSHFTENHSQPKFYPPNSLKFN